MATLKCTWRFNDVLTKKDIDEHLDFTIFVEDSDTGLRGNAHCNRIYSSNTEIGVYIKYNATYFNNVSLGDGKRVDAYSNDGDFFGWRYENYGEGIQTITFPYEQTVSDEFYEWFTANATEVPTRIIKAGTYRFADILDIPITTNTYVTYLKQALNFTVENKDTHGIAICDSIQVNSFVSGVNEVKECQFNVTSFNGSTEGLPYNCYVYSTAEGGWKVNVYSEYIQTITIPYDQLVTESFLEWFSHNTYMVSKNGKSGVTIEWDGNTEGLLCFQSINYLGLSYYRVSDRQFTREELTEWGYWYSQDTTYDPCWSTYSYIDCLTTDIYAENVYLLKNVAVVTRDWTINGMTVPVGVYVDQYIENDFFVNKIIFPNADAVPPEKIKLDITQNGTTTLVTAGKYCDKNIAVSVDVPVGDNRIDDLVQGTISGEYVSNKVTSVKDYAFYKCNDISSVRLPNCTDIGSCSFGACQNLESVDLPMCTSINGNVAFRDCTNLKTVNLPNVTTITDGTRTFHAAKLEEVNLPNLTSIGTSTLRMFANCDYLKKLDLRKLGGTTISSYTFYSDDSLKTLILGGSELNPLENINAFENAALRYGTGYIYVPDELVESYKTATNWVTFADRFKPMSELGE